MNRPSLDNFQPRVTDGGIHIINSSLIDMELADTGRLKCFGVPCNEIADELGNTRMANMVAIGAYVQATGIIPIKAVIDSLENVISPHYHKLIPANTKAIEAGAAHVA
jgi:2-oxoglutarate ferredoxin oxidoreductase subunit gamma